MVDEARLQRDLQDAMRARERLRIDVLRGVITAVKNLKIEKQVGELPEAEIVGVLRKELNKRLEIADFARTAAEVCRMTGVRPGAGGQGYRTISNAGTHGVQEVPHYHMHILGGRGLGRMLSRAE